MLTLSCNLPSVLEATLVPPIEEIPQPPAGETASPETGVAGQVAPSPTEDFGSPPSFEDITWPEGTDAPEERDGKWYLRGQPVALSYHRNAEGEKEIWLTLENEPDWPIIIQRPDGTWIAGVEVWDGNLVVVNANESPVTLIISKMMEGNNLEELSTHEIAPYEIFNLASLPPTRYEFRFQFTANEEFDLTCAVNLAQHSPLTFTVVPAGIAVTKPDLIPESNRDLDLRFSPLCGG